MARLLHQPRQAKRIIKEVHRPLGHVLPNSHCEQARELTGIERANHLRIRLRLHEDVPIREQERVAPDKAFRNFRCPPCAILHNLPPKRRPDTPAPPIRKVALDRFSLVAGHDKNVANARRSQPPQNVLQNRFTLHLEHRLGHCVGQFLHPRAFARR